MKNYKKILIKLSGEVLGKKEKDIFNERKILAVAKEISSLSKNYQIAVLVGGGNIFRWRDNNLNFLDRVSGDWVGIKATILNGLVLAGALKNKFKRRVLLFSDHKIESVFKKYNTKQAKRYLDDNNIVIITGQGKPGQTNDTNAANTAKDLGCEAVLKGSKVTGIYSSDPKKYKNAKLHKKITYQQAIDQELEIMDNKAFKICKENKIPIIVFDLYKAGNIKKAIEGKTGTLVE